MNAATLIVLGAVLACLAAALIAIHRDRRRRKDCGGCPMKRFCQSGRKDT